MNEIISKDTTALYVDGWLAEFLFFDGENITFKKAHGADIGKVFKIPLSDWYADEYGLSYETKEYKDKKVEVNNISKVATLATINTNELLALINLRDALHFLKLVKMGCGLTEQQHYDMNEAIKRIEYAINSLESD